MSKWCYGVIMIRGDFMAYFLKKSNLKKGTYLQIYESFYDPERKGTAHRSYRAVGYVNDLVSQGIDDPVSFFQQEVDSLNKQRAQAKEQEKIRQISDETPEKHLGYFPLKALNDGLGVKKYLDLMQTVTDFRFNVYDMMSALIYSRAVMPCSKSRTFHDVVPKLQEKYSFTMSQMYSGLEYIGMEYEKVIEIYNHQLACMYPFDISQTYFDCTNFYFEIDKEDDLRRKGPSKENRKEPIVGLGLLLDSCQIPIGMKIFPGNESEKPVIRETIDTLKKRSGITGKTVRIADKGLNCTANIVHALKEGDGYIFSKSVKQLPETEKTWVLLDNDYKDVKDSSGSVLYRIKECVDDFDYPFMDKNGRRHVEKLHEKRVVTYNPKLAKKQTYEINRLVEKAKTLRSFKAKRTEYGESAKYVSFLPVDKNGEAADGKIKVEINNEAIQKDLMLAGYNLLVTSETDMSAAQVYSAYHNLWRIEESFRIMKSQLDARPVYLQKEDTITGHFLICYLAVLLERLVQLKILDGKYSSEEIFEFFREFKTAKISERKYINLSKGKPFIKDLAKFTGLPLTSYFLTEGQIKKIMDFRFQQAPRTDNVRCSEKAGI